MIVFSRGENNSHSLVSIRRCIASTLESILTGYWIHGSDPFIFSDARKRRKTGMLVSEKALPRIPGIGSNVPDIYQAFCPNRKLFLSDLALRLGRMPKTYKLEGAYAPSMYIDLLKGDMFEKILPIDMIGIWRRMKRDHKRKFLFLRHLVGMGAAKKREEFSALLSAIHECLSEPHEDEEEEVDLQLSPEVASFLERYEDRSTYERLVERDVSLEQLLEEEMSDDFLSSFEDDGENDFPDDFEIIEEDEEEEEIESPPLNEVRRLVRFYNQLSRDPE